MEPLIADGLESLVVRIDTVRPDPANPRRGDVEALKRSLRRFGQRRPVVARADGTITAGHHLHAAAVQLGWHEIAVLFCDDDEVTAHAFALADNRTGDLGRYENDLLGQMLAEVAGSSTDLLEAASYTEADVAVLLSASSGPPVRDRPDPGDIGPEPSNALGGTEPPGDQREAPSATVCPNCGWEW